MGEKFIHKKSLGQNFLKTESILDLIADSADIKDGKIVIEIGPGEGALTRKLLDRIESLPNSKLLCIEKDHRLIPILQEKFSREIQNNKLILLERDILRWGIGELGALDSENIGMGNIRYKLVANIPYYITGAIMGQFLSYTHKPSCIIIMVQKEVADRVVAKNGKQSILALCTKYYGDSEIIKIVKPGNFNPPPKEEPYRFRKYQSMIQQALIDPVSLKQMKISGDRIMIVTQETPGPRVGLILNALFGEVLDDPSKNTVEYLEERALHMKTLDIKELRELAKAGKSNIEKENADQLASIRKDFHVK